MKNLEAVVDHETHWTLGIIWSPVVQAKNAGLKVRKIGLNDRTNSPKNFLIFVSLAWTSTA